MHERTGSISHPNILLAEDDHDLRELLAFSLLRAGYRVTRCDNGLELFELLEDRQREPFDLVLSDLRMPALTGLEALEALHDAPGRPPFICMTAFGEERTHAAARNLGAAATIDKPFDIEKLITLISRFCPLKGQDNFQPRRETS